MDPDPFNPVHRGKGPKELGQSTAPVQVEPVERRILGDQHQFPDAFRRQAFRLSHKRFHGHGTVGSPDEGDGTVRAAAVTAFRDFQESIGVAAVCPDTAVGRLLARRTSQCPDERGEVPRAEPAIHLRNQARKLVFVALGKTAEDKKASGTAFPAASRTVAGCCLGDQPLDRKSRKTKS